MDLLDRNRLRLGKPNELPPPPPPPPPSPPPSTALIVFESWAICIYIASCYVSNPSVRRMGRETEKALEGLPSAAAGWRW